MGAMVRIGGLWAIAFTLALAWSPDWDAEPAFAGGVLIYVDTVADEDGTNSAACSLREAIKATNANGNYGGCLAAGGGSDGIEFALSHPATIMIGTVPLPDITDTVTIDGNLGSGHHVEIKGSGPHRPDVFIVGTVGANGAHHTVIRNFVINDADTAINVRDDDVTIAGNYLGTDPTGTFAGGAREGVYISGARARVGGTNGLTPGGPCTGDCNVLSGNSEAGVYLNGPDALIQGNFIGTNPAGTAATPNEVGVQVRTQAGTIIGGPAANAGNLISGNTDYGVMVQIDAGTTIQRNRIGTNAAGTGAVPNGFAGVTVQPSGSGYAGNVTIGGPGLGNVISGNTLHNIVLYRATAVTIQGNIIGPAPDGVTPLSNPGDGILLDQGPTDNTIGGGGGAGNIIAFNTGHGVHVDDASTVRNNIFGNSIHDNGGKGIENTNGGNTELAPPVITAAVSGTACPICLIAIYSDSADEGRVFDGAATVSPAGNWSYTGPLTGPNVTATATDGSGNTSEFSAPFTLPATPTPTPSPTATPTTTVTPTQTSTVTPGTPTPSLTATPSPTTTLNATSSGTAGPVLLQGDIDCSGAIDEIDMLLLLEFAAGVFDGQQVLPCPDLGEPDGETDFVWGDLNCDGAIDGLDALFILLFDAGLETPEPADACTAVGGPIS